MLLAVAALVVSERHLWLNRLWIGEKDRAFLLDAPLSPSGLFGDAARTVVERLQETERQSAIPSCQSRSHGVAARG